MDLTAAVTSASQADWLVGLSLVLNFVQTTFLAIMADRSRRIRREDPPRTRRSPPPA